MFTNITSGKMLTGIFLLLFTAAFFPQNYFANEAPHSDQDSHVVLEWEQFKNIVGWEDQPAAKRDHITVSWTELQDLFGIEVKDVQSAELQLPWREFRKLLEWSLKKDDTEDPETKPPVPIIISSAEYLSEEISEDGALFTAKFKIDVFQEKGWKKINLVNRDLAIREINLPEGSFINQENLDYVFHTNQSGSMEVTVKFSVKTSERDGLNSIFFYKVPSPSNLLDITVPEKNAQVEIPNAQSKLVRNLDNGTRVIAALPVHNEVRITWERAIPEPEKVPPKIFSETRTLVSVADDLLFGHQQITFNILHTATRELALNVPNGVSVIEVLGSHIRDWRVKDNALTLQLDKDWIGIYQLTVKYEAAGNLDTNTSQAPVLTAKNVEREKGHIGIVALSNVEIEGTGTNGATKIDVKDLPSAIFSMTSQPVLLAFRYVESKFNIDLNINRHQGVDTLLTAVDRAVYTVMQTVDGRRIIKGLYQVRNNRNQFLRLTMPEGAEIWSVSVSGKPAQPALDPDGKTLIPLVRSQSGSGISGFPVEVVYVEEGSPPDERGRGFAKVELPQLVEPITHLMVNLYVPEEGRYTAFDGTLRLVDNFHHFQRGGQVFVAENDAVELQNTFVQQQAEQVQSSGASQVEVSLPVSGEQYKLEKILVVREPQWFSYSYSGLR